MFRLFKRKTETINLKVKVFKKRDRWIAHCKALKSFGSGETREEAILDLFQDIDTFIQVHNKRGTLKQTLINFKIL